MPACLEVSLFGPDAAESVTVASSRTSTVAAGDRRPLADVDAHVANRLITATGAEFFAVCDGAGASTGERIDAAALLIKNTSTAAAVIAPSPACRYLVEAWDRLPTRLAALVCEPEPHAVVVFRKSAFEEIGPFHDVPRPIWDWLIRATAAKQTGLLVAAPASSEANVPDHLELPCLGPSPPSNAWIEPHVEALSPGELVGRVDSPADATALKAGVLQIHGFLDASHRLAQSVEGQGRHHSGDYWHAIMHRREPDYSNSKYWFRHVGSHPIFDRLAPAADGVLQTTNPPGAVEWTARLQAPSHWDPFAFVDLCQHIDASGDGGLETAARKIQFIEMLLLLEQTLADAAG